MHQPKGTGTWLPNQAWDAHFAHEAYLTSDGQCDLTLSPPPSIVFTTEAQRGFGRNQSWHKRLRLRPMRICAWREEIGR